VGIKAGGSNNLGKSIFMTVLGRTVKQIISASGDRDLFMKFSNTLCKLNLLIESRLRQLNADKHKTPCSANDVLRRSIL